MKDFLRSLVPLSKQVTVKYLVNGLRNQLEPELRLLPYLVQRGQVAVDIGGNRGQYAYALWRLGSKVEVFEPNPVCHHVLSAWASKKDSVTVYEVGLSDTQGEALLHIPVDDSGVEHDASGSLVDQDNLNTRHQVVSLSSLDSFALENVVFVKIDVEGHEYNVLRGGEKLFHRQRPSLLVEIEQRHINRPIEEIFGLVESWGYCGFFLRDMTLESLECFDAQKDQRIENFDENNTSYINNFLFLSQDRLDKGCYQDLFAAWGGK